MRNDNNLVARGARSVVRAFRGDPHEADQENANGYEQVYTQKVFTLPRYQQHMIDDYFTVQACSEARPGTVRLSDFQIKHTRSLVDPNTTFFVNPEAARTRLLDRLIEGMASCNSPPKLIDQDGRRVPRFDQGYDWTEQRRVRAAMLVVVQDKSDATWWRLREHVDDKQYVLTASRSEHAQNFSVCEFCRDFFIADLSIAYARHLPNIAGRSPAFFHPEDVFWKNEKEWSRSQKPLYEIQIKICQQAVQQWAAVKGTVAGEERQSHTYTADEKARFIEAVTKEIEELRRTQRATFLDATLPGLAAPSGWEGLDENSKT